MYLLTHVALEQAGSRFTMVNAFGHSRVAREDFREEAAAWSSRPLSGRSSAATAAAWRARRGRCGRRGHAGALSAPPCGCTPAGPRRGEGVPEEGGAEAERVVAEDEARRGDVAEGGVGEEQRAGEREGGGEGAGDDGGRVRAAEEEAAAAAALVEAEDELVEGSGREGAGGNGRHQNRLIGLDRDPNIYVFSSA